MTEEECAETYRRHKNRFKPEQRINLELLLVLLGAWLMVCTMVFTVVLIIMKGLLS